MCKSVCLCASVCTLSMKLAKRLLRLFICSFSWLRLSDRLGSISKSSGASRLLFTDSEASGTPSAPWWWWPLAYREPLPREMPLKPTSGGAADGARPLSLRVALLLRTELLQLILLLRLRLMMDGSEGDPTAAGEST